jgi:hypothetical protein
MLFGKLDARYWKLDDGGCEKDRSVPVSSFELPASIPASTPINELSTSHIKH